MSHSKIGTISIDMTMTYARLDNADGLMGI